MAKKNKELSPNKQQIYDFFQKNTQKPWHLQELQKQFKLKQRNALKDALEELVSEGKIIRTRRRTFGLPKEMNLIIGRLQITAGDYGFVIPEDSTIKDLFIAASNLAGAWDGDKVVAKVLNGKKNSERISGEILRVLERKHNTIIGTLEYSKGYAILRPDSNKIRERILLLPDSVGKLAAGSRLVAEMVWPEESNESQPFARVVEDLGKNIDPKVETRAVIVKYGLKDNFDQKTLEEVKAIPLAVDQSMLAGRSDLRKINCFTIDGADAKDFDDAISVERIKSSGKHGILRLGIHIADVSYYVAEGTSLDKEAKERATSVYLPNKVLPMLPEELSNGICSLKEAEDRLTLSVLIDISRSAEIKAVKFKETVINSKARLTYEQVENFAEGGRLPQGKRKLERDIALLIKLTQSLRKNRLSSGALDFNLDEARVEIDDDGKLQIKPIKANKARQLIEELMLLANKYVAREMTKLEIPALFRVHESPSFEKLQILQKALAKLGYLIDPENLAGDDLQKILQSVAGKSEAQLVNTLILRSLKQAHYDAKDLGHFGLAFENYLHFTSPIRRYPDLVVHRIIRAMLQHRLSPTIKERWRSDFPELGKYVSERERNAESAERDLSRFYQALWAKEHVAEKFDGLISGVTNFGVFVTLTNGVEGLIHISNLDDDYYEYLADSMMLIGRHNKHKFILGNKLEVKIAQSNPVQRQVDLLPAYMDMKHFENRIETKQANKKQITKEAKAKETKVTTKQKSASVKKKKPSSGTKRKEPAKPKPKKKRKRLVFGKK